ncbi:F-box protein [Aspergillus clavatus NRRL 1]|uniref:F-box domain protein n=1 Tax=Aspergillus clavatus (strain ATCC 1007 / CBS 513.65 / DSM 816 / NCTC 3887 / NRRL 1 / QM 1276 / 107) TaxID=344612 RepID=A1CPY7_ASPCL|nr:F-box domain protein [Aspergillus clavatus NRRL 1]EAW07708.1 F-box domain protein [Aspergillus clavatus NRRL 1]
MATHLPTELLQSILLSLDLESFYSARLTCSSWHHAASNPFILRSALAEAPVSLPATTQDTLTATQAWNTYLTQFAHRTLLDRRLGVEKQASKRLLPAGYSSPSTTVALSPDGTKVVALKGARIMLHDFHRDTCTSSFALSRSLYPVWACVCRALVYGAGAGAGTSPLAFSERYAKSHIALSSRGDLVAVALGRTIQIYDLAEKTLAQPPAEFVLGDKTTEFVVAPPPQTYQETDGVVESVAFAGDDDLLLRVVIGRESGSSAHIRVRYLGDPARASSTSTSAESDVASNTERDRDRLAYWRANLNRIYLDSAALAASLSQPTYSEPISLTGLLVLPNSLASRLSPYPTEPSYTYFLCALHQGFKNSYCLARTPTPSTTSTSSQPPAPPTILFTFPTRPSDPNHLSTDKLLAATTPESTFTQHIRSLSHQRWDVANLPAATAAAPVLAVADDGALFAVYEPGAGHSYRGSGGAVYVYSLAGVGGGPTEGEREEIPAWSFLLDIVDVEVEGIRVTREPERESEKSEWGGGRRASYMITAIAGGKLLEWRLK